MAVSFNTSADYGTTILSLFGVPQEVIDMAKTAGVKMAVPTPGNFSITSQDGMNSQVVPIKAQAISLAKSGQLGPASAQEIKYRLMQALEKVLGHKLKDTGTPAPKPAGVAAPAMNILGMMTKKTSVSSPNLSNMPKGDTILPGGGLVGGGSHAPLIPAKGGPVGGTPIPLCDASDVYQPTKGSSPGAVYYVAAMFQGLNLSVRNKKSSLSLRVEGPQMAAYKEGLQELGFDIKSGYASVHFDIVTPDLKIKTIGAVVGRLGFAHLLKAADLNKLVHAA